MDGGSIKRRYAYEQNQGKGRRSEAPRDICTGGSMCFNCFANEIPLRDAMHSAVRGFSQLLVASHAHGCRA